MVGFCIANEALNHPPTLAGQGVEPMHLRAMPSQSTILLITACALPVWAGATLAQESTNFDSQSDKATEPIAEESHFDLSLNLYNWSFLSADLEDAPGDVYSSHSGLGIALGTPLNERLSLNLNLAFELSAYDFSSADPFTGSTTAIPDNFVQVGLQAILNYTLNDQWSLVGGGFLGFAMDPDADLGDAIIGGGTFGAGYIHSEDFRITFGLTVRSRIEDDPLVTPLIVVYNRINDRSYFQTVSMPQGFGLSFVTEPLDDVEFELFGGWQYRQWRLDGGPAAVSDGVLRDSLIVLGAGVAWKPTSRLELRLRAGAVVFRELEVLSSSGSEVSDVETNAGAFIGVRLAYRF